MAEVSGTTSVQADVPAQTVNIHPSSAQVQAIDPSVPAKTTFQEDLVSAGQRRVNLIWEHTQAIIAISVVISNMFVATYQGIISGTSLGGHPVVLSSALFLVVGFYFARTNHTAIGGVGPKPPVQYFGR